MNAFRTAQRQPDVNARRDSANFAELPTEPFVDLAERGAIEKQQRQLVELLVSYPLHKNWQNAIQTLRDNPLLLNLSLRPLFQIAIGPEPMAHLASAALAELGGAAADFLIGTAANSDSLNIQLRAIQIAGMISRNPRTDFSDSLRCESLLYDLYLVTPPSTIRGVILANLSIATPLPPMPRWS